MEKKCTQCKSYKKYVDELESDKRIQANLISTYLKMFDMMLKEKRITSSDFGRYVEQAVKQTIEEDGTK